MRQGQSVIPGLAASIPIIGDTKKVTGGLIVDEGKDVMAAVHVPLAMALMGLAVWLPLRARKR